MIYENGRLLAESERFPKASGARSPTSIWTCCAPSGSGWVPSTTIAGTIRIG